MPSVILVASVNSVKKTMVVDCLGSDSHCLAVVCALNQKVIGIPHPLVLSADLTWMSCSSLFLLSDRECKVKSTITGIMETTSVILFSSAYDWKCSVHCTVIFCVDWRTGRGSLSECFIFQRQVFLLHGFWPTFYACFPGKINCPIINTFFVWADCGLIASLQVTLSYSQCYATITFHLPHSYLSSHRV